MNVSSTACLFIKAFYRDHSHLSVPDWGLYYEGTQQIRSTMELGFGQEEGPQGIRICKYEIHFCLQLKHKLLAEPFDS